MKRRLVKPTPPREFATPCERPLDYGDSPIIIDATKRMLGPINTLSDQNRRVIEMSACPMASVPGLLRHHVSKARHNCEVFTGRGGADFCPERDDLADVCALLRGILIRWLDLLEPCFVGLERKADPDGYYRNWYSDICDSYGSGLDAADARSPTNQNQRYGLYQSVIRGISPELTRFFDDLGRFLEGKG